MRDELNDKLESGRLLTGYYASEPGDIHGAFVVVGPSGTQLTIMSSGTGEDCAGWEHVSVSTKRRTPNWTEMCWVKDAFWREDECVIQYHPARSDYIDVHPFALHLWRKIDFEFPMPPAKFV